MFRRKGLQRTNKSNISLWSVLEKGTGAAHERRNSTAVGSQEILKEELDKDDIGNRREK